MTLWQIGLLVFLLAGAVNALFIHLDAGGLPRELGRLSILTGLVLLVVGLVKPKKEETVPFLKVPGSGLDSQD